jgi:hypothetical protein
VGDELREAKASSAEQRERPSLDRCGQPSAGEERETERCEQSHARPCQPARLLTERGRLGLLGAAAFSGDLLVEPGDVRLESGDDPADVGGRCFGDGAADVVGLDLHRRSDG